MLHSHIQQRQVDEPLSNHDGAHGAHKPANHHGLVLHLRQQQQQRQLRSDACSGRRDAHRTAKQSKGTVVLPLKCALHSIPVLAFSNLLATISSISSKSAGLLLEATATRRTAAAKGQAGAGGSGGRLARRRKRGSRFDLGAIGV